jgi:formate/nitrite transporter FocA (FNT family)
VLALGLAFAAALIRWSDTASRLLIVVSAAASGAFVGFWLAAEWTNVDDRDMVGERFPVTAVAVSTALGAVVLGGAALLATMRWG